MLKAVGWLRWMWMLCIPLLVFYMSCTLCACGNAYCSMKMLLFLWSNLAKCLHMFLHNARILMINVFLWNTLAKCLHMILHPWLCILRWKQVCYGELGRCLRSFFNMMSWPYLCWCDLAWLHLLQNVYQLLWMAQYKARRVLCGLSWLATPAAYTLIGQYV